MIRELHNFVSNKIVFYYLFDHEYFFSYFDWEIVAYSVMANNNCGFFGSFKASTNGTEPAVEDEWWSFASGQYFLMNSKHWAIA